MQTNNNNLRAISKFIQYILSKIDFYCCSGKDVIFQRKNANAYSVRFCESQLDHLSIRYKKDTESSKQSSLANEWICGKNEAFDSEKCWIN